MCIVAFSLLVILVSKHNRWKHGKKLDVVMYNYGSPRVGNTVFVEDYNDNVPNSWRIANDDDAVTKVPFLLGYAHAGHCLRLEKSGISKVQDNGDHGVYAARVGTCCLSRHEYKRLHHCLFVQYHCIHHFITQMSAQRCQICLMMARGM